MLGERSSGCGAWLRNTVRVEAVETERRVGSSGVGAVVREAVAVEIEGCWSAVCDRAV